MMVDKPNAGRNLIVHGGENRRRSISRKIEGAAWKLRSTHVSYARVPSFDRTSMKRKNSPFRNDQTFVNLLVRYFSTVKWETYSAQSPVQHADKNLHRCTADGQDILEHKQPTGHGQIRQQARGKCHGRQGKTDDGQVLKMPAIGRVPGMSA